MRLRHYILLLFSIVFLTYLSSLWNQFVWDDEQFIYNNEFVKNFQIKQIFTESTTSGAGVISDYYRPLTTLSFAVDTQIWGVRPFPFHLVNTLLHSCNGILLFYLLFKLSWSKRTSFWIALLFLVHPLQTEAVTYINSRGDSLYTFFGLLSAISFILFIHNTRYSFGIYNLRFSIHRYFFGIVALLFYGASILSKEIGIASGGIPFLIFAFSYFKDSGKNNSPFFTKHKAVLLLLGGYIFVAIGYIVLRATTLNFINTFDLYNDGSLYSQSVTVRLLTFSKVIWIYFGLLFFPYPLHMERVTDTVTSLAAPWPWLTLLMVALLVYLSWREYRQHRTMFIAFGSAWFFGMLLPVSGIIPINGVLYEHWLYLPMVGFFSMFFGLYHSLVTDKIKKVLKPHLYMVLYSFTCLCILLTIRQNYFWSTPIRLYEYLLNYTISARIYNNLGMEYANANLKEKAIEAYIKSLELSKHYPQTYHNLANSYRDIGKTELAIENYKQALAINPGFYFSYTPLIQLLIQEKRYTEAASFVNVLQTTTPNDPTSYYLEITLLTATNELEIAQAKFKLFAQNFPEQTALIRKAQTGLIK